MASYVISHASDQFYLVVPKQEKGTIDYMALMQRPFMPFTPSAWLGYAFTICVALLAYTWLEVIPRWKESSIPRFHFHRSLHGLSSWNRLRNCALRVWMQVQIAAYGLAVLSDQAFQPMTYGGKIVSIAVQLFIVSMVASYTANLAAVLSTPSLKLIQSLDDAISRKLTICVPTEIPDFGHQLGLDSNLVLEVMTSEIFASMESGDCQAGLLPEMRFEATNGKYGCKYQIVGRSVSVQRLHLMVQEELVAPVSRGVERLLANNVWHNLESEARVTWPIVSRIPQCKDNGAALGDDSGALDILDMGGLYLLVILAVACAVLIELLFRCLKQRGRMPSDGPTSPSFEVTPATVDSYAVSFQDHTHVMLPPGECTAALVHDREGGSADSSPLRGIKEAIARSAATVFTNTVVPEDPIPPSKGSSSATKDCDDASNKRKSRQQGSSSLLDEQLKRHIMPCFQLLHPSFRRARLCRK